MENLNILILSWKERAKKISESQQNDGCFGVVVLPFLALLGTMVFFSAFRLVSIADFIARFVLGSGVVIFSLILLRKEMRKDDAGGENERDQRNSC